MGTIKKITVLLICLFFSTMLLAGECEVKIKVHPPRSIGGAHIDGYYFELKRRGEAQWKRHINTYLLPISEYTFTGGFEHDIYEFRVIAVNKYGLSKPSDPGRVDFAKSEYWEVFLVCEDGASPRKISKSNTNAFNIDDLIHFSYEETTQVPYRPKE